MREGSIFRQSTLAGEGSGRGGGEPVQSSEWGVPWGVPSWDWMGVSPVRTGREQPPPPPHQDWMGEPPNRDWMGVPPIKTGRLDGVPTPPPLPPSGDRELRGGRYVSIVHAGGLSCGFKFLKSEKNLKIEKFF